MAEQDRPERAPASGMAAVAEQIGVQGGDAGDTLDDDAAPDATTPPLPSGTAHVAPDAGEIEWAGAVVKQAPADDAA